MIRNAEAARLLDNPQIPVQLKLAAAWTSFMFLYLYVDYLHLYKPGAIEGIMGGLVWEFEVSQALMTAFLTSVAIPSLMILLSVTLPARANRAANIVVASLNIPYAMFNAVGESWFFFYGLSIGLEVLILAFILRSAWTWPRTTALSSAATGATAEQSQVQVHA